MSTLSEHVLDDWRVERLQRYANEQDLDVSVDDWSVVLHHCPEPPVGWIALTFRDDQSGRVVEECVGPYWCEADIVEDVGIYRALGVYEAVERTTALSHDDMCEWLNELTGDVLRQQATTAVSRVE